MQPFSGDLFKGMLSFFIDLVPFVEDSGDGSTEVIFNPNPTEFDEREPNDQWEDNYLPSSRVEFREWLCLPDYTSPAFQRLLTADMREEFIEADAYPPTARGSHLILGHPEAVQNLPLPNRSRKPCSLLTQFGPDPDLRLEACDGGTWYFMTPTADLKKGKFDNTYMEFQTG